MTGAEKRECKVVHERVTSKCMLAEHCPDLYNASALGSAPNMQRARLAWCDRVRLFKMRTTHQLLFQGCLPLQQSCFLVIPFALQKTCTCVQAHIAVVLLPALAACTSQSVKKRPAMAGHHQRAACTSISMFGILGPTAPIPRQLASSIPPSAEAWTCPRVHDQHLVCKHLDLQGIIT